MEAFGSYILAQPVGYGATVQTYMSDTLAEVRRVVEVTITAVGPGVCNRKLVPGAKVAVFWDQVGKIAVSYVETLVFKTSAIFAITETPYVEDERIDRDDDGAKEADV